MESVVGVGRRRLLRLIVHDLHVLCSSRSLCLPLTFQGKGWLNFPLQSEKFSETFWYWTIEVGLCLWFDWVNMCCSSYCYQSRFVVEQCFSVSHDLTCRKSWQARTTHKLSAKSKPSTRVGVSMWYVRGELASSPRLTQSPPFEVCFNLTAFRISWFHLLQFLFLVLNFNDLRTNYFAQADLARLIILTYLTFHFQLEDFPSLLLTTWK